MKPIIGITVGDYNGIGPEVALKAALAPGVRRICKPMLIGPLDVFAWYARRLRLPVLLREVRDIPPTPAPAGTADVLSMWQYHAFHIEPGKESVEAGAVAGEALTVAAHLAREKAIAGMVTAPVSKATMNAAGYAYPGQTEMLAALTGSERVMMMLMAGTFRVGLVTVHLPLRDVAAAITPSRVVEKLVALSTALRTDLGVNKPKIAMLGMNPHAGEQGMLGTEEREILVPALAAARRKRITVEGPFPADGFFGRQQHKQFDAVLAMYHDQGLIPLKLTGFDQGVNFSSGLNIVRTSPDHGTAFDLAGRNKANPSSMIEAVRLAVFVAEQRRTKRKG